MSLNKIELYTNSKIRSLLIAILLCMACSFIIYGQQKDTQNQLQLEQIIAKQKAEKLANESEMLRMKLEMEKAKVRNQLLIIIFGTVLCSVLTIFTLSLYFSRKQIRKKNRLLNEQNTRLAAVNQQKERLIGIIANDLHVPLNQSKDFTDLLRDTSLQPDQLALVNQIAQANNVGLLLIREMIQVDGHKD
ncbi:MAG: hypothetical protein HOP37_03555 [Cyclobacteriaceae bacterium]|nr:hypothetical protein [Cyclobacteriaceae bacterium]